MSQSVMIEAGSARHPLVGRYRLPRLIVEASDSTRYYADLRAFSRVYCFPTDQDTWERVSIDSYGLDLVWPNRFEVHADQVLGLAYHREPVAASSAG